MKIIPMQLFGTALKLLFETRVLTYWRYLIVALEILELQMVHGIQDAQNTLLLLLLVV